MYTSTKPPRCCGQEVPAKASTVVDSLIVHHLNPLLLARSASLSRLEQFKTQGRHAAAMDEAAALATLDDAYQTVLARVRLASA